MARSAASVSARAAARDGMRLLNCNVRVAVIVNVVALQQAARRVDPDAAIVSAGRRGRENLDTQPNENLECQTAWTTCGGPTVPVNVVVAENRVGVWGKSHVRVAVVVDVVFFICS